MNLDRLWLAAAGTSFPWPALRSLWDAIYPEFVLAILGAVVVVWQIRKQFSYALAQSRHNEVLKLRLSLYQEIVPTAHAVQDALIELQGYIRKFETDVILFRQMAQDGRAWSVPEARVPLLIEKNSRVDQRAVDIIFFVERWQIAYPRLDLFKTAVNVALHEMRAAWQPYFSTVLHMMPAQVPPGDPRQGLLLPWQPPDAEGVLRLEQLTNEFNTALSRLSDWLHDLQVELQNLFLGELFEHKAPCRQPLDPDLVVVRLDRHEELKRHFEEETNWVATRLESKTKFASKLRRGIAKREDSSVLYSSEYITNAIPPFKGQGKSAVMTK
jgi:hypothetical protein